MKSSLQQLDAHLNTLRPEYYKQLNPPLSSTDIAKLEKVYDISLPDEIKLLYQWKNGQSVDNYEAFVNNSMFLPLEDVLDLAAELTSMIGSDFEIENWWHADWLPLFDNGGGDHICYDLKGVFTGKPGQLIEFWHDDNDRNVIYPDLLSLLKALNKYYETTPKDSFDEYFQLEEMIHGYPKKFLVE